jgi:hypothetical protein
MELAHRLGWAALVSGVVLIVAAIGSLATGADLASPDGADVNSLAAAAWILGSLGVVFLIHAFVLFAWSNQQLWAGRRGGRTPAQ